MRMADENFAPSAFVTCRLGKPLDILIFTRQDRVIEVRSAVQQIDPALIGLFAEQAFDRYPAVDRIEFQPMMIDKARAAACLELSNGPIRRL